MWWTIGAVVVLTVLAGGAWLLGPTLRTFRGPDFEPASKDDASVTQALQSGTSAGATSTGLPGL
jgi:hypothetical protein